MTDVANAVFGVIVLGVVGALLVWLVRNAEVWGGRPTAAILAGLLAGVLIGPHVAGQVYGHAWRGVFVGGQDERAVLDGARRELRAQTAAMLEAGTDPDEVDRVMAEDVVAIRDLSNAYESAKDARWTSFRAVCGVLAGVAWLLTVVLRTTRRFMFADDVHAAWALFARVFIGTVVLIGFGTAIGVLVGLDRGVALSVFAVAVVGGSAWVPMRWMPSRARRRLLVVGSAGSLAASSLIVVLGMFFFAEAWFAAIVAGVIGVGLAIRVASLEAVGRCAIRRWIRRVLVYVLVPVCVATVMSQIDFSLVADGGWTIWALGIVVLVASTDGRWLVTVFSFPRRDRRDDTAEEGVAVGTGGAVARSIEGVGLGAGITQVLGVALLFAAGVLDPSHEVGATLLVALIAGALVLELVVGGARVAVRATEAATD